METFKEQNEQINRLSINMEDAIKNCLECFKVTTSTLQYCLDRADRYSDQRNITLLKECADMCEIAASFMMESSDFAHDVCGICARICDLCGDNCYDLDSHDPVLQACMRACKNCADSCRNMEH